jgi:hypothetical protein
VAKIAKSVEMNKSIRRQPKTILINGDEVKEDPLPF